MSIPSPIDKEHIAAVAVHLGVLRDQVVFVGGATTELLVTDPTVTGMRLTEDVDVIINLATRMDYYRMEESLRSLGFQQNAGADHPICRWNIDGITVDIMPTDENILGFSNRWYPEVVRTAIEYQLTSDISIRLINGPCFLATKIEAFNGRGRGDYLSSYDLEDVITVVDGRPGVVDEVQRSGRDLKSFLAGTFRQLLDDGDFIEALPGYLLPDALTQSRLPTLMTRMESIAQAAG